MVKRPARTFPQEPSRTWWLANRRYTLYFLRELSSLFIAVYVFLLALLLAELSLNADAYSQFTNTLRTPPFVALSLIILFFSILHSTTWFILIPKVQPVKVQGHRIPSGIVSSGFMTAWIAASGLVFLLFAR